MSLVGEKIDAWCLKCKLELAHVVLYERAGQAARVKCQTCGAEHMYRGLKPQKKPGVVAFNLSRLNRPKSTLQNAQTVREAETRWVLKNHELKPDRPIRAYDMKERYTRGDVINHPQFGLGFVERIVTDNRIDILFRNGLRTLGMNYVKSPHSP